MRRTVWMPLLAIGAVAILAAVGAYVFFHDDSAQGRARDALKDITPLVETVRQMEREPDKFQRKIAEDQARRRRQIDENIAREPGNAQFLIDRAVFALQFDRDYAAVIRDVDAALQLDKSRQWYFLFLRHRALDGLGRPEEALATVLEAIRLAPPGYGYERFAAELHQRLGNPDAGALVFDESLRREPTSLHVRGERANYLAKIGRFDEAVNDITIAVEREPNEDQRRLRSYDRMKILTAARRFDEAMAVADRYINQYPDDSSGYGHRSNIHEAMGNHDAARRDEEKRLDIIHSNR